MLKLIIGGYNVQVVEVGLFHLSSAVDRLTMLQLLS